MQALFDDKAQAAEIGVAILTRLTEIAANLAHAACKRIQRFLRRVDPRRALRRLFQEQAECRPERGGASPGPEDRVCGHPPRPKDQILAFAPGFPVGFGRRATPNRVLTHV